MGDPVPSSAISDATTGGLSVIVITGGSTGDVLTLQANGTYAPVTPSGGVSGTGSVDNAVLRADGTGGSTLQNSAWVIADNYTASPNNTVNHASLSATGGTTDVSVSIKPKGAGAFSLAVPDATTTGGNTRGAYAVDFQRQRANANQVASGITSFCFGANNRASGDESFVGGTNSVASSLKSRAYGQYATSSGAYADAFGSGVTASGSYSWAYGSECTASGFYSYAFGNSATATRYGQVSYSVGVFSTAGDAQTVGLVLRNKTTNNTPVNLFLDGSSTRLTVPSGKTMSGLLIVKGIKSDGTTGARFVRLCDITNLGGTTALDVAAETIGTDWNPQGCTLAVTGENATDDLQINITAPNSETWRWVSRFIGLEIAYGT